VQIFLYYLANSDVLHLHLVYRQDRAKHA
jgi:hypothetical protein